MAGRKPAFKRTDRYNVKIIHDESEGIALGSEYQVVELKDGSYPLWSNLVTASKQGSIFNDIPWLKIISAINSLDYKIIGCFKNGNLIGGCALYIGNDLEGKIVFLPPLVPYNGIILSEQCLHGNIESESDLHSVLNPIIDYLEKNFDFVLLVNPVGLVDMRPFLWNRWNISVRYTYLLSLDNSDTLFDNLAYAVKKQVKKAQKSGFSVTQDTLIDNFLLLWELNLKRQKVSLPLEKGRLTKLFIELSRMGYCKMYNAIGPDEKIVASRIVITSGLKSFDWVAAADPRHFNTGANQFLMWSIIEDLFKDGFKMLDFLGADIPSIAAYKATFGGHLSVHYQASKAITLRARTVLSVKRIYRNFKG